MNRSSYGIGINYSKSNIYFFHKASTPPFNPPIPIIRIKSGDYILDMLNINFRYSILAKKFNIEFILDNMIPLQSVSRMDEEQGSIIDNLSFYTRIYMLTQLNMHITYKIK